METKRQLLVAPQGSWKWQHRLRLVEYRPVQLKNGRKVWGDPRTIDDGVSGGNIRDYKHPQGAERSCYMQDVEASA